MIGENSLGAIASVATLELTALTHESFEHSHRTYGAPRIHV